MKCRAIPYEGEKPYIFFSYAHKDADRAYPILETLVQRGYRVWYDDGNRPGENWVENIAQHLSSCHVFLAMLSANSERSHNCKNELNYALKNRKNFLAVKLEEYRMSKGTAMQLASIHYLNLQDYSTVEDLARKLCEGAGMDACYGDDWQQWWNGESDPVKAVHEPVLPPEVQRRLDEVKVREEDILRREQNLQFSQQELDQKYTQLDEITRQQRRAVEEARVRREEEARRYQKMEADVQNKSAELARKLRDQQSYEENTRVELARKKRELEILIKEQKQAAAQLQSREDAIRREAQKILQEQEEALRKLQHQEKEAEKAKMDAQKAEKEIRLEYSRRSAELDQERKALREKEEYAAQKLEQLRQSFAQQEKDLAAGQRKLEEDIARYEARETQFRGEMKALQSDLQKREDGLNARRKELEQKEKALDQRQKDIENEAFHDPRIQDRKEAEAELRRREERLQNSETVLQSRQRALDAQQKKLEQQQKELDKKFQLIADAPVSQLVGSNTTFEEAKRQLAKAEKQLNQREKDLTAAQTALKEQQAALAEKEKQLQAMADGNLAQREKDLAAAQAALQEREKALAEKETADREQLVMQKLALVAKGKELKKQQQALEDGEKELQRRQEKLERDIRELEKKQSKPEKEPEKAAPEKEIPQDPPGVGETMPVPPGKITTNEVVIIRMNTQKMYRMRANRITLGRSSNCYVALDNDAVAMQQANLVYQDNGWYLRTTYESTGTYLGERRLHPSEKAVLTNPAVFRLADEYFMALFGDLAIGSRTMGQIGMLLNPATKGIKLVMDKSILLGRSHEWEDGTLRDSRISREHAEIVPCYNGFQLRDKGGVNGTFLNDKRLDYYGVCLLHNRDRIVLGDTTLEFLLAKL